MQLFSELDPAQKASDIFASDLGILTRQLAQSLKR